MRSSHYSMTEILLRVSKSRIKSMDGIFKKAKKKKNIPITMEGIEEGIRDIAG